MKRLDTTHKLFSPAQAEAIAAAMQAGDEEGWAYRAVHDPRGTGYSFVEVYDEEGECVARV
jgi:hypothetical protein